MSIVLAQDTEKHSPFDRERARNAAISATPARSDEELPICRPFDKGVLPSEKPPCRPAMGHEVEDLLNELNAPADWEWAPIPDPQPF